MDSTILFLIVILILISYQWMRYYWTTWRKLAKLPQIKGNMLFGNIELFTGKLFEKQSTPFYQRVVDGYNKVFNYHTHVRNDNLILLWALFTPYILLTNAKSVEEVLSNQKLIEKSRDYNLLKPWLSSGLLTSGSEKWKSRRKFLTPSFHFRILNDFIQIFNKHSRLLVNKFKEKLNQPVDIVEYVKLATLDIICETAMGVCINAQKSAESKYFIAVNNLQDELQKRGLNFLYQFDFIYFRTEDGKRFKKDLNFVHRFTDQVIQSRKKIIIESLTDNEKKEDDNLFFGKKKQVFTFMDLLIKRHLRGLQPDGTSDFTLDDIREEVNTFMFEGFDTTSAAIMFTLQLLGLNPEIQEKAYNEIQTIFGSDTQRSITEADLCELKYLELCIKESLRLYPSVPWIARKVTEDVDICGYCIPKNATISIYIYGLQLDPEIFPEPEKFIPERFLTENCLNRHPFAYVPFSAGPRNCIGQKFAMIELKITIAEILRNFKVKSMKKNISISVDVILKAREAVFVTFTPRF